MSRINCLQNSLLKNVCGHGIIFGISHHMKTYEEVLRTIATY